MANTYIETLKKQNGDQIAPRTVAEAVKMADGTTVEEKLEAVDIELDKKLTRKTISDGNRYVYTQVKKETSDGIELLILGQNSAGAGTVVRRTNTGTIRATTPEAVNDVTTKQYVDSAITEVEKSAVKAEILYEHVVSYSASHYQEITYDGNLTFTFICPFADPITKGDSLKNAMQYVTKVEGWCVAEDQYRATRLESFTDTYFSIFAEALDEWQDDAEYYFSYDSEWDDWGDGYMEICTVTVQSQSITSLGASLTSDGTVIYPNTKSIAVEMNDGSNVEEAIENVEATIANVDSAAKQSIRYLQASTEASIREIERSAVKSSFIYEQVVYYESTHSFDSGGDTELQITFRGPVSEPITEGESFEKAIPYIVDIEGWCYESDNQVIELVEVTDTSFSVLCSDGTTRTYGASEDYIENGEVILAVTVESQSITQISDIPVLIADNTIIYPKTKSEAVEMADGKSLEEYLAEQAEQINAALDAILAIQESLIGGGA